MNNIKLFIYLICQFFINKDVFNNISINKKFKCKLEESLIIIFFVSRDFQI